MYQLCFFMSCMISWALFRFSEFISEKEKKMAAKGAANDDESSSSAGAAGQPTVSSVVGDGSFGKKKSKKSAKRAKKDGDDVSHGSGLLAAGSLITTGSATEFDVPYMLWGFSQKLACQGVLTFAAPLKPPLSDSRRIYTGLNPKIDIKFYEYYPQRWL